MLIFDWKKRQDDPAFDAILMRLKVLVADMEAVQKGEAERHLREDAPVIDRWLLAARPAACLIGQSTGHPLLRARRGRSPPPAFG